MIFNDWLDILLFKKKPADLAATTLGEGLKQLVIANVILGALVGILNLVSYPQIMASMEELAGLVEGIMPQPTVVDIVVSAIATPIVAVIGMVIIGAILHLFCKLLGGKGSLSNYVGVLAILQAAVTGTATVIITVLGIVAALGGAYMAVQNITGLLGFVVGLWLLVLTVLATQAVQQISRGRAITAILLPWLVLVVLIIIGVIFFAGLIGAA
ncbi:MAG: YIP1 family protein, partial [archaeon]|nr:YIP1 family protein [archaeon]